MDVFSSGHSVCSSQNHCIREVQFGQVECCLCQFDSRFILFQALGLFLFLEQSRLFLAQQLFIACLCRFVIRFYPVELLGGNGFFFQQFLITFVIRLSILQTNTLLINGCIRYEDVVLCGVDSGMHGTLSGQCIAIVGFGLCHFQTVFRIFYDGQGISFFHCLIFLKTDFLDEALYPCADRSQVLLHLGIVCIFHIT